MPVANAIYSNVVQRIHLKQGSRREWVAKSLQAATRSMKGYGVSIESLNYDMWKVLVVLVPPLPEQAAIVEYLDQATANLDADIDRANREIELLNEYRKRLISDVVTGKLDVREAARKLPDDHDADAPDLDERLEEVGA